MKTSHIRATTGIYEIGSTGNNFARQLNNETAFNHCPSLQKAIDEHEASKSFMETRLLRYNQRMEDGFRARFGNEVILVDARRDDRLRAFLDSFQRSLDALPEPANGIATLAKIKCLVAHVWQCAGGLVSMNSQNSANKKIKDLASSYKKYEDIPIGAYLGGAEVGRPGHQGIGICRHRSILFKYTCDMMDVTPCALLDGVVVPACIERPGLDIGKSREAGEAFDHMWNLIWVNDEPLVVDCMAGPEAITDGGQLNEHYLKYHRIGGRSGLKSLKLQSLRMSNLLGQGEAISEDESEEQLATSAPAEQLTTWRSSTDTQRSASDTEKESEEEARMHSFTFKISKEDFYEVPEMMEGAVRAVGLDVNKINERFLRVTDADGEVLSLQHRADPDEIKFPLRLSYGKEFSMQKTDRQLRSMAPGSKVQVWSEDGGSWQDAVVVELRHRAPHPEACALGVDEPCSVTVEYKMGTDVCRKTVRQNSKALKVPVMKMDK